MAAGLLVVSAPTPPVAADGNEAPANPFAFRAITAGEGHSCALVHQGTAKCWGWNSSGQLGVGDTAARGDNAGEMGDNLPAVDLGTGRTATAITAGDRHTCALLDNATVRCWGANNVGQLGLGDTTNRGDNAGEMGDNLPAVNLGTGRTATAITAGGTGHTCALLDNATVKCWGANDIGQLGLGNTTNRGDNAGEMGDNLPAVNLGTSRTATAITAGGNHICARLDNATVKCWGYNFGGQLGLGDTANRGDNAGEMGDNLPAVSLGTSRTATAITAGNAHTCALLDNGAVKCWGFNNSGKLGLGDTANRGDAAGEMGDALPTVALGTGRTATAVTAGDSHTCVRLDNATAKCWGANSLGQLGLGDTATRGDNGGEMGDSLPAMNLGTSRTATAITTGIGHTCALLDDATAKCWGTNIQGGLGLGDTAARGDNAGEMGDALPAVRFGSARTATAVTTGGSHSCALLDNATVRCWGENTSGQLGLGDTAARGNAAGEMGDALPTVSLGTGRTATTVTAGESHTCAILDDATVKCWGGNSFGQLGLGDTSARGDAAGEMGDALPAVNLGTGRTATAIAAGAGYTCARLDNGTVKCWGTNVFGQLGVNDTSARGDVAGEMGNALPAVPLGTGRTATAVTAGNAHTCARLDNATVKCWGRNSSGQLGLGDIAARGDEGGEMGDLLPAVSLGTGRTATTVSAGGFHTCARLDNATVKCWGLNAGGQVGLGDTANRGDNAGEMGDALPAVSLGAGRTATGVGAGNAHTCVRLDNATVKCWGTNGSGRLGLGDTASRGDAGGEMGDALPAVSLGTGRTATTVTAGFSNSCARLDNATVKCWGTNGSGQLGLGDTANRGDSAGEMGLSLPAVDLGSGGATGVSGTVVDSVSAAPVPGAFIAVLRTADFSIAAGPVADGSGNYTVSVPPGAYFIYVVDPTGAHTAGFSGPPTVFTVTADTVLDADPTAVPTRGSVTGAITETGPNTPIAGSWAIALTNGGIAETGVVANGSGHFTLPGLNPANHFLAYIDPTGNHPTRFFPNSPDVPSATLVNVTAGGSTVANGSLPTQTATGTGAALTGTITEQGTGNPLANVFVIALNAADFTIARGGLTNGSGAYTLNVVAGGYKMVFLDSTGLHNAEWHDNQPASNLAGATTVTAPTTTNAALDRNRGSITGTVTDDPSFSPVPGVWVLAIGPTGISGGAVTAANGTYTIVGLPPGTHRVEFVDPNGGRTLEFFDNQPDFTSATTVNITAGNNINNLDGHLALP